MTTATLDRVIELKSALKTRVDSIEEAMKTVEIKGADINVPVDTAAAIKKLMSESAEIKSLIEASEFGTEFKAWASAPKEQSVALGAMGGEVKMRLTSLGQAFVESEEFKSMRQSGGFTMTKPFEVAIGDIASPFGYSQKDVYAGQVANAMTRNLNTIQFDPIVPRGYRPTRVRDLFPVANTSSSLIDFFQVSGFAADNQVVGAGQAVGVSDYTGGNFGVKPKSNLVFTNKQAPVRTIAHWEAAHRNSLDDLPQLQSIIDNELMYGLRLVEDFQILFGAGGNDLDGIMLAAGIQTYTPPTSEIPSDTLRRAATQSVIANYAPTGYVLHPNDWENVELQRGADGQYMLATNVSIGASTTVWRLPVAATPAMTQGQFLTGAFGIGCQIYDRQEANVRIAEQHSDFFVRNAVAVLAEERLALALKRPEAFVKGTFA